MGHDIKSKDSANEKRQRHVKCKMHFVCAAENGMHERSSTACCLLVAQPGTSVPMYPSIALSGALPDMFYKTKGMMLLRELGHLLPNFDLYHSSVARECPVKSSVVLRAIIIGIRLNAWMAAPHQPTISNK